MQVIRKESVLVNLNMNDKIAMLDFIAEKAYELNITTDINLFKTGLINRENEMSTCFTGGIAIPHCREICISEPSIMILRNDQPIVWDAEGKEAKLFIVLAIPAQNTDNAHIKLLSQVARKLVDTEFVELTMTLTSQEALFDLFNDIIIEKS